MQLPDHCDNIDWKPEFTALSNMQYVIDIKHQLHFFQEIFD